MSEGTYDRASGRGRGWSGSRWRGPARAYWRFPSRRSLVGGGRPGMTSFPGGKLPKLWTPEEKNSNTSLDQPLSVDSTGVFMLLLILLYEGLSLTLVWLSGYFVAYLYI